MAVRGTKPKPEGQARNRNRPTHDWTEVVDVPFKAGKKLAARMPNGLSWPPATRAWWKTISSMPHCVLWSESDWQFAIDTAFIAGIFHLQGDKGYATELRNREKVLGTTADYRRDLRIRYIEKAPTNPAAANVTSMDAYRDL